MGETIKRNKSSIISGLIVGLFTASVGFGLSQCSQTKLEAKNAIDTRIGNIENDVKEIRGMVFQLTQRK